MSQSPPLLYGLLVKFVVASAYSIEVNSTPKPSNGVVAIYSSVKVFVSLD